MQVQIPRFLIPLFRPLTPSTTPPSATAVPARTRAGAAPRPRGRYGELYIFEKDKIWMRLYPLEELVRRLPFSCSYFFDMQAYQIQGMAIGGPIGLIPAAGIGWALASTIGAVLCGLLGGMLGLLTGWMMGPSLCPRPVFLVRRTPKEGQGEKGYELDPIEHSYLMSAVDPASLAKGAKPGVFLGSSWDSIIKARAARRFFTSMITRRQMMQMAAPVVLAVCSVVVVFVLIMATQD